jgi:hypothetical protein
MLTCSSGASGYLATCLSVSFPSMQADTDKGAIDPQGVEACSRYKKGARVIVHDAEEL